MSHFGTTQRQFRHFRKLLKSAPPRPSALANTHPNQQIECQVHPTARSFSPRHPKDNAIRSGINAKVPLPHHFGKSTGSAPHPVPGSSVRPTTPNNASFWPPDSQSQSEPDRHPFSTNPWSRLRSDPPPCLGTLPFLISLSPPFCGKLVKLFDPLPKCMYLKPSHFLSKILGRFYTQTWYSKDRG